MSDDEASNYQLSPADQALMDQLMSMSPEYQLDDIIRQMKVPLEKYGLTTDDPVRLIKIKPDPETARAFEEFGHKSTGYALGERSWPPHITIAANILFRATLTKEAMEKNHARDAVFNCLCLISSVFEYNYLGIKPLIDIAKLRQAAASKAGKASARTRNQKSEERATVYLNAAKSLRQDGRPDKDIPGILERSISGCKAKRIRQLLKQQGFYDQP